MAPSGTTGKNDKLLAALAAGSAVARAAKYAGVSKRTAFRRLADPEFRRLVDEARGRMLDATMGQLAKMSAAAAATLRRLLGAESEKVQLGAARSILESTLKLRDAMELQRRVEALEQQAAQQQGGRA